MKSRQDINTAMRNTQEEIFQVSSQLENALELGMQRVLNRKLTELEYLQRWHMNLLERIDE